MITRGGTREWMEGRAGQNRFLEGSGVVSLSGMCEPGVLLRLTQNAPSDSLPVYPTKWGSTHDSQEEDGGTPDESSQSFAELFRTSRCAGPRRSSLPGSHECTENPVVGSDRRIDGV